MSVPHHLLAEALLAHVPGPHACDALLARANPTSSGEVRLPHGPSEPVALRAARGPANMAALVASAPDLTPDALDRLSRHSSRLVRREVAGNPNTPVDALERLRLWAVKHEDQPTLDALYRTLPLLDYLPRLTFVPSSGSWAGLSLGVIAQLRRRADPDHIRQVFRLAETSRRRIIATYIFGESIRGTLPIDPADLLDEFDDIPEDHHGGTTRADLLEAGLGPNFAAAYGRPLDGHTGWSARFTEHVVAWIRTRTKEAAAELHFPHMYYGEDAAAALVSTGLPRAILAVLSQGRFMTNHVPDPLLEDLVNHPDFDVRARLLNLPTLRARLTDQQIETAVEHFPNQGVGGLNVEVLDDPGRHLSDRAQARLIALSDSMRRDQWIQGRYRHQATAAGLVLLAQEPGWSQRRTTSIATAPAPATTAAALLRDAAQSLPKEAADDERIGAMLNLNVGPLLDWLSDSSHGSKVRAGIAAAYLSRRLTARFGDNPHAWAAALEVAPTWGDGSVDELLDALAAMTVVEGPAA